MLVDVQQTADHESLGMRIHECQKGMCAPEAVPDTIVGVEVWLVALPKWVLAYEMSGGFHGIS